MEGVPNNLKTFGDQIKAKRFEQGTLQRESAEKLSVPIRLIQFWEHDTVHPVEESNPLVLQDSSNKGTTVKPRSPTETMLVFQRISKRFNDCGRG